MLLHCSILIVPGVVVSKHLLRILCVYYTSKICFLFKILGFPSVFVKAFVALEEKLTLVNLCGVRGCLLTYPGRTILFHLICFCNILTPVITPC